MSEAILSDFFDNLCESDALEAIRSGLVGIDAAVPGPFGDRPLIYADYIASGRALRQIERFILDRVLPFYANSHTEASFCGRFMTRLRAEARSIISRSCNANEGFATIFAGAGATSGINRLVSLFGIAEEVAIGRKPAVFVGPYEHHSNILPWRESGAEVIEIPEAVEGGPDLETLEAALHACSQGRLKVGTFSAASNVNGIITDADAVSSILRRHDALSVWDYAGAGPYLPIDMRPGTAAQKDAVVISTHKFIGGPAASGILIVRKSACRSSRPSTSGGGTVRFVSPWGHDFSTDVVAREEAGTPNVIGDIRAGMCFLVKAALGCEQIERRHAALREQALDCWAGNPSIELLGNPKAKNRLPFFAFRIRSPSSEKIFHPQLVTRLLSDLHGIQARGGCACAGPYAHRLLDIDENTSQLIRAEIMSGNELLKPGWTRLNLSVLLDDAKATAIIMAVAGLHEDLHRHAESYIADERTARFRPVSPLLTA